VNRRRRSRTWSRVVSARSSAAKPQQVRVRRRGGGSLPARSRHEVGGDTTLRLGFSRRDTGRHGDQRTPLLLSTNPRSPACNVWARPDRRASRCATTWATDFKGHVRRGRRSTPGPKGEPRAGPTASARQQHSSISRHPTSSSSVRHHRSWRALRIHQAEILSKLVDVSRNTEWPTNA